MDISLIRVLVVDDYEPWRRHISNTLQKHGLLVMGEASDGLEAVQLAQKLQPDLILLDISLPTLNGLEAAGLIREVSPSSKILVVSQNEDAEIAERAFGIGASGFVMKSHAASELIPAVEAVLEGKQFRSASLAHHAVSSLPSQFAPGHAHSENVACLAQPGNVGVARLHEAEFYSEDDSFLDGFTQFIGTALKTGRAVIVIVTGTHRHNLLVRLHGHELDIGTAVVEGRCIFLDAADALSRFMVNGLPDSARFLKVVCNLIQEAADAVDGEKSRVAACGECAPLLWTQGNMEAAIRLERLWDDIALTHEIDILCGYSLSSFQGGFGSYAFGKICSAHSDIRSR